MFCNNKKNRRGKNNNNKITTNRLLFLLSFRLVSSRHTLLHITVTFKILHTFTYIFIKKINQSVIQINSVYSINSNWKDLTGFIQNEFIASY